jgi:hypothetical protein
MGVSRAAVWSFAQQHIRLALIEVRRYVRQVVDGSRWANRRTDRRRVRHVTPTSSARGVESVSGSVVLRGKLSLSTSLNE